jgi:mannosyltransferase
MTTETQRQEPRWDWGLAAVAAVALAFRLPNLTTRSFWFDESSSWQTAKFSFPEMLRSCRLNVHMPFYYTLLKGWMAVWGESVVSLRGFSIFFGVLTVVAMGLFAGELYRDSSAGDGREADRRWFARVVALLVAVSPMQVFLSVEARMYSLGTTFAALGAWLLLRALRDPAQGRPWWAFAAACAGMVYTHHYGLFTVASWFLFLGLYAAWLMGAGERPAARAVVAGASKVGAAVAAIYLPGLVLLRMQVQRVQQDYWIPPLNWRIFWGTFSQFLIPTYAFDFLIGGWIVCGVLALACLAIAAGGRRGDGLVLASSVCPLLFSAGVSAARTVVWHHRYFLFAQLSFLAVLALAIWKLTRWMPAARWALVAAVVAVLIWGDVKFWEYFDVARKTGIRGAVETILARRRPDEMIVTFDYMQYFPLKFYAGDRAAVRLVDPGPELFWGWHLIRPEDLIAPDRLRDELREGLWVVGKDPKPWESPELEGAEVLERYEFRFYHSVHRHFFVFHLRGAGGRPAREGPEP